MLPLVAWLCVVFGFSSQPYRQQNLQPTLRKLIPPDKVDRIVPNISFRYHHGLVSGERDPYGFIEFFIRKFAHLFEYGMLGLLSYLVLFFIPNKAWRVTSALLLVAAAAMTDEWNQAHVEQRTSTVQDVFVDLTGAAIALTLFNLVKRWRYGRMKRNHVEIPRERK